MIKASFFDSQNSLEARVLESRAIVSAVSQNPPIEDTAPALPFRQFFTDDGKSSGSSDMTVDGSASPQPFFITASNDFDIFINSISFRIADQSATPDKFGAITALTNGCELSFRSQSLSNQVIADELKSNFDIIRLAGGVPAFGDGATAFRVNNAVGNSEGYIPFLDISDIFGLKYGIHLRKSTQDNLAFIIKDNVSGLDGLDIIGYGIRI